MNKYDASIRLKAVKHYLGGNTLVRTAARFKIHRNTLWRWIQKYRRQGSFEDELPYTRHGKRLPAEWEETVIALKESQPGLTVRRAQQLLGERGLKVSLKGIWSIWQRHGLTGFAREEISHAYQKYLDKAVPAPTVARIKALIRANQPRRAAEIVNALPLFPFNDIILRIPTQFLCLRRRVNRIRAEFGRIPLDRYVAKARNLRHELEDQGMYYSSLWVAIAECYALMWSGRPREVLGVVRAVTKRIQGMRDARLWFLIFLLQGQANAGLMRISQAKVCVERCKTIARTSKNPYFLMGGIGGVYSTMGYYREALYWTARALKGAAASYQQQLYVNMAQFHATSGDYRAAAPALKLGKLEEWGFRSRARMIRAYAYLDQGDFQKALAFAVETLLHIKKEGVRSLLHPATLILASCHCAAGDIKKAHVLLGEIVPLLKKFNLKQEYWLRKMILGSFSVPREALQVPGLRLVHLLRRARASSCPRDYRRALAFAQSKKILGIFMRLIPFFPEPVTHLLNMGRNPGLPRTFLNMPVFRVDTPVFQVSFLGKVRVQRRGRPARRAALSPKDTAFLVHMALNKNRRAVLSDLYDNFWRRSRQPARNLSHLLTRLRRCLAVPSHSVRITSGMLYWDIYFSTDFDLVKEHLAKARFFEQAAEKMFATREYKRALRLYRGDPFHGMYDPWSEQMRRAILNTMESIMESCAV